jgi:hypothetical protein
MLLTKPIAGRAPSMIPARLGRFFGGGLLGTVALGWIAVHCGPPNGQAVVHVAEADVELIVGGNSYRIEGRRYSPIVCELPAGRHELSLVRDGRVLYRESFGLRGGESAVLTAWDPVSLRGTTDLGSASAPDATAPPARSPAYTRKSPSLR